MTNYHIASTTSSCEKLCQCPFPEFPPTHCSAHTTHDDEWVRYFIIVMQHALVATVAFARFRPAPILDSRSRIHRAASTRGTLWPVDGTLPRRRVVRLGASSAAGHHQMTTVVGVSSLAPRRRHGDNVHAPPRHRGGLVRAKAFGIEETFVGRREGGRCCAYHHVVPVCLDAFYFSTRPLFDERRKPSGDV